MLYAREGAKVFAVDINLAAAKESKAIIDQEGGECTAYRVDVTSSEDVRVMVEKCMMLLDMDFAIRLVAVEERYGSIGGLF